MEKAILENKSVAVTVFRTEELGVGSFDDGRIQEIKPIPFPQESGGSSRLGPLFYWAWASSLHGDGVIPWHPHQGFDIVSYVLSGRLGHRDTLGTDEEVAAGGLQVMQAGAGLQHREEIRAAGTEFLQIWFEPNLQETTQKPPVYRDFADADFPRTQHAGWREKSLIGGGSPVQVEAPVTLSEWQMEAGKKAALSLPADSYWTALVLQGSVRVDTAEQSQVASERNFIVVHSEGPTEVSLQTLQEDARLVVVQMARQVDYPLYRF